MFTIKSLWDAILRCTNHVRSKLIPVKETQTKSSIMPTIKNLEPSFTLIQSLIDPTTYTVALPNHHLNTRQFEVTKSQRQYEFSSSAPIIRGLQTHKEIQFEAEDLVKLSNAERTIYALGKYILLNHITYSDDDKKLFSGSISSFSTSENNACFDGKLLRFVIPLGKTEPYHTHDFQLNSFETPKKSFHFFISLVVSGENFQLFQYKKGSDWYLVLDCTSPTTLTVFQKKCFNILLALGFITGNLIHDECFILSFDHDAMETPKDILYHSMRASVYTGQATFTTNPFSVNADMDFERDENGGIKQEVINKLNEGILRFPDTVFSNLATSFFEYEKLQRAALLFIQSHLVSLEMRLPNYYVALEAISGHILSVLYTGNKSLSPIKDATTARDLIQSFKDMATKLKDDQQATDEDFNMEILIKNIDKINAPPNADKLAAAFAYINYPLSAEQKKILKDRNTFLHGSFLKIIGDDSEFRDALHLGLRQHFMIALLLLKLAGFSGKIINYAALWSHITEKKLTEDRLVSI